MKIKKVRCLRRVSTDRQDSEMQLVEMEKYCKQQSSEREKWVIDYDNIYNEDAISAFKNRIEDRPVMNEVLEDAKNKEFDIFLAYKFDRIGRKGINTQNWIYQMNDIYNIPVWTADEGFLATETMVDQIKLSIYAGKAQQESRDTSKRVRDNHTLMTERGIFRGGVAPYGYRLVRSGEMGEPIYNKKGKELFALIIDEGEEGRIAVLIFDLIYYYGYGSNRVAKYLNTVEKVLTRNGTKWRASTIRYIVRNPIYKGIYTYGKTASEIGSKEMRKQPQELWTCAIKPNPKWIIVDAYKWDKVQGIIDSNIKKYNKKEVSSECILLPSKGKILFGGLILCGYCKSAMSISYNSKRWKVKNGTEKKSTSIYYRCTGKADNKTICQGQSTYSKNKIEPTVLEQVYRFLEQLKKVDYTQEIYEEKFHDIKQYQNKFNKMTIKLQSVENEIDSLTGEISKALMGKSKFSEEMLSEAIKSKKQELANTQKELKLIKDKIQEHKYDGEKYKEMKKFVPWWIEELKSSPFDIQKAMLAIVIKKIEVYDNNIEVDIEPNLTKMYSYWLQNAPKQ